jgi:hypothetical protein
MNELRGFIIERGMGRFVTIMDNTIPPRNPNDDEDEDEEDEKDEDRNNGPAVIREPDNDE